MTDIAEVAHHEAGHAVAAFVLHLSIGRKGVTIVPSDHALGALNIPGTPPRTSRLGAIPHATRGRLESYAIAAYAGYEAQKRFCPSCEFSGDDDEHNASELLSWVSSKNETLSAHLTLARLEARDLVERYWKQIEAVATALLERKTLNREEVRQAFLSTVPLISAEEAEKFQPVGS